MEQVTEQKLSGSRIRAMGVMMLVISAVVFMVQGIATMSSFERYLSFAAVVAGLGLLGIYMAEKAREPKSARTFFGLAAAATPVLFSQLGSMIHSIFSETTSVPQALLIRAPSMTAVVVATAVTAAVMTPILYIGFSALFRKSAKKFVFVLLSLSALLLVPSRDSVLQSILISLQAAVLVFYTLDKKVENFKAVLHEERYAKLICFVPVAIMFGRSLFYPTTDFFYSTASFSFAILYFNSIRKNEWKFPGVLAAGLGWAFGTQEVLSFFNLQYPFTVMLTYYPIAIATMAFDTGRNGKNASMISFFAAMCSFFIPFSVFSMGSDYGTSFIFVLVGVAVVIFGLYMRKEPVFLSGVLTSTLAVCIFAIEAMHFALSMPWVSLAVLGMSVILFAGWLEKNPEKWNLFRENYRDHFAFSPEPPVLVTNPTNRTE